MFNFIQTLYIEYWETNKYYNLFQSSSICENNGMESYSE
jgi:hypothetical protein